jgi:hypothetical protein
MAENEPLHPAVNPDLYVNLDEQREGTPRLNHGLGCADAEPDRGRAN